MINWERHAITAGSAAETLEQYEEIGLDNLFTITQASNVDTFTCSTDEGDHYIEIALASMSSTPVMSALAVKYKSGSSSSIVWSVANTNLARNTGVSPSEASTPLYIDKLELTGITLIRFTYEYVRNSVLFAFDTATAVDTGSAATLLWVGCSANAASVTDTTLFGIFKYHGRMAGTAQVGDNNTPYLASNNYGMTAKYMLTPYYVFGVKSNIYAVDGGQARIPAYTEFMIGKTVYLSIGNGACVKVS